MIFYERVAKGRREVIEMRPDLAWNKGKAVEYILEHLEADGGGPVFPIYFGDNLRWNSSSSTEIE